METLVKTPIDYNLVRRKIQESKLKNVGKASIREVLALINSIEKESPGKIYQDGNGSPRTSRF